MVDLKLDPKEYEPLFWRNLNRARSAMAQDDYIPFKNIAKEFPKAKNWGQAVAARSADRGLASEGRSFDYSANPFEADGTKHRQRVKAVIAKSSSQPDKPRVLRPRTANVSVSIYDVPSVSDSEALSRYVSEFHSIEGASWRRKLTQVVSHLSAKPEFLDLAATKISSGSGEFACFMIKGGQQDFVLAQLAKMNLEDQLNVIQSMTKAVFASCISSCGQDRVCSY